MPSPSPPFHRAMKHGRCVCYEVSVIKVSFHTKVERKEMMQKHEIAYFDYIENWGFENDNLIKMSFL